MIKSILFFGGFILLMTNASKAQDFSGSFYMPTDVGDAILVFEKENEQVYTGTLSNAGYEVDLEGSVVNGILEGSVDDGSEALIFQAQLQQHTLVLKFTEVDFSGNPVPGATQVLVFEQLQQKGAGEVFADTGNGKSGNIIINEVVLTASQKIELEALYGVAPLPGDYWYDSISGLYGVVGYQAFGFMYPGHEFGPLPRDVSQGNTSVIVNGRELPQLEWLIWSYMLGYPIQVGSYWLDEKGNAGYEGNPQPLVNLYSAAQQNAYSGQGGSGDNFWSTRFSAGNSDSGNQRGYVSVPGHGPIGYGF